MTNRVIVSEVVANLLKHKYLFLSLAAYLCIVPYPSMATQGETEKLRISLALDRQILKTAIKNIESQTGYKIIVDDEILQTQVTGRFQGITVDNFFSRIAKNTNVVVLTDTDQKIINVTSVGGADYVAHAQKLVKDVGDSEKHDIDPMTGRPWPEVDEQMQRGSDNQPNTVRTALTEDEFLADQADYIVQAIKSAKENDENFVDEIVDPLTGLTWPEIDEQMQRGSGDQ